MCEMLVWSFDAIAGLPWLELIKAFAPVVTAFIAYRALQNWKRQDKGKRQADFLDQLTDAINNFVGLMPGPVSTVHLVRIGMASHIPHESKNADPYVAAAIEYIEKRGATDYKHMADALDAARPAFVRLQSLAAKGQVFGFDGYIDCQNAIRKLTWQFGRVQALASFIHSSTWYWQNPEIIEHLKKLMEIDHEDIAKHLDDNTVAVHAFLRDAYERIYR